MSVAIGSRTITSVLTSETGLPPIYPLRLNLSSEQRVNLLLESLVKYIDSLRIFLKPEIASWKAQFEEVAVRDSYGKYTVEARLNASKSLSHLLTEIVYPAVDSFTEETFTACENQIKEILRLTKPDDNSVDDFIAEFIKEADEKIRAKAIREGESKSEAQAEAVSEQENRVKIPEEVIPVELDNMERDEKAEKIASEPAPVSLTREQEIEQLLKSFLEYIVPLNILTNNELNKWVAQFELAEEFDESDQYTDESRLKMSECLCFFLTEVIFTSLDSFSETVMSKCVLQIKRILALTIPDEFSVEDFIKKFEAHADKAIEFIEKDNIQQRAIQEGEEKIIEHARTVSNSMSSVFTRHKEGILILEREVSMGQAKTHRTVTVLTKRYKEIGDTLLGLAKDSESIGANARKVKEESKRNVAELREVLKTV